jgi:hypothetical protein
VSILPMFAGENKGRSGSLGLPVSNADIVPAENWGLSSLHPSFPRCWHQ